MVQSKDIEWLNGKKQNKTNKQKKNMTHIFAVYKRPTSEEGTHTD